MLIVDDDPEAYHLLTAALKGERYRLVHANSGEEAMKLAHKTLPDSLLLVTLLLDDAVLGRVFEIVTGRNKGIDPGKATLRVR